VIMPLVAFTVVTAKLPLTHVPPGALLVSVVLVATHKFKAPEVTPGEGLTVTALVAFEVQAPIDASAV
jgi:hypothetical protein